MGKKMDARQYIRIRGANENNLKNIDVDIPRNELVVLTGLSGSGKSSLAFDTIYAEGQRRYMESLSSYARQFLGQMEKPDVESIEGLSPAISIDQKSTNHNPFIYRHPILCTNFPLQLIIILDLHHFITSTENPSVCFLFFFLRIRRI